MPEFNLIHIVGSIETAIRDRAWYPLAAALLTVVIELLRRWRPQLVAWLAPRWQWVPACVLAAAVAFVDAQASGLGWTVALALAVYSGVTAGPAAVGLHRIAKESSGSALAGLLVVALAAPMLGGCAGSLETARAAAPLAARTASRDTARCRDLDAMRRDWGAVAKGAAVLTGGAGLATIPAREHDTAAIGLAAGAVGAAVVAAVAVSLSESAGEQWARECSAP